MQEKIMDILASPGAELWPGVLDVYTTTCSRLEMQFNTRVAGFEASDEETEKYVQTLRQQSWDTVRGKLREEFSDPHIQVRLRQTFEDAFRYNEDGLPRVWQSGENMDDVFVKARDKAEALVSLFAKMPVPEDCQERPILDDTDYDDDAKFVSLMSTSRQRDLKDRLRKDADTIFLEAKRGAVASLSEVPRGMWLLLLLFGFNEIYALISFMLSNPIVLVLLLILVTSLVFLYQSGLLIPIMRTLYASAGPASKVLMASAGPLLETAITGAAEFFKQLSDKMKQQEPETSATTSTPSAKALQESPDRPPSVASNLTSLLLTPLSGKTQSGTPLKKRN